MSTQKRTASPYPLAWPEGWPRTEAIDRQGGAFKCDTERALRNLRRELELMGAINIVLSSNCALGQDNPPDPGVCAYFEWDDLHLAIPCDRWVRLAHNIQAIALSVEAMRGLERWGARHMLRAMFSGFKQLSMGDLEWWKTLGFKDADVNAVTITEAYRRLVKEAHPDTPGGTHERFIKLQRAYESGMAACAR